MEYINSNDLKSASNIHDEFNILNFKLNYKSFKIKPRNIFNNNKLFAYKKASGNIKLLKKLIHKIFIKKYFHDINFYNSKVIEDILNNQPTHVVAEFKDYLIYGDDSEFLQNNYIIKDSRKYLPKIFKYYESCSVIFPNYVTLYESKYLYKNIQRKQRIIDVQQEQEEKIKKIKEGQENLKDNSGDNIAINLFNTTEIYSILKETNTSNINKIFGVNNNIYNINTNNKNENENSESILNNIINELNKVDSKKTLCRKKINLFKSNKHILPSLTINGSKALNKNNIYTNRTITNRQNNKYLNSENNNIMKYNKIIQKSLTKRKEGEKSTSNLNSKKKKESKNFKERKKLLSNDNLNAHKFYKIPKSKLSVDINAVKKHKKIKSTINEQDLINKKGMTFFNCILKKKKVKRKSTNFNTNIGKISTKIKKLTHSFIPSQKNLVKEKNKNKNFHICKSTKRRNEHLNKINYSSSPNIINKKANIKSNISIKVPMIFIKDSNSTSNIIRNNININNISSSRSRSIIRKRKVKKDNEFLQENNNYENYTYNLDIMSEPNMNITSLPITDKEKNAKKIFFTFAPNVNNVINLNKIKYILKNIKSTNISNISNLLKKSINKSKSIQNYTNKKDNNIVNKKNLISKRNILINKKKSNSFKSSYNTQISSSLCTACSFGKNSHLIDIETIKIYTKRKSPNSIIFKAKSNKEKNKKQYNNFSKRKFSLSPDKLESKQIIKKMLINNAKLNSKKIKKNKINKKFSMVGQHKRQKNIVLPIRKDKETFEIKTKDMIHLLLKNKFSSDHLGKISRNSKTKNSNEKSILTFSNKTHNSINSNGSNKKPLLSIKSYKNNNKNKNNVLK